MSTENNTEHAERLLNSIARFVEYQASDPEFLLSLSNLRLPSDVLSRLAKSALMRCTLITKYHNGPIYTFVLENKGDLNLKRVVKKK